MSQADKAMKIDNARCRRMLVIPVILLASLTLVFAPTGCAGNNAPPTSQPVSAYDRGDKALKDPMNYQPQFEHRSVSGGGTGDFDKNAFNKDVNDVLNP